MKDRGFLTPPERHLGKKMALFGIVGLVLIFVGGYIGMTAWYYFQIKQGKKIVLENPYNFTSTGGQNSMTGFDRGFLEGGSHPYRGKREGAELVIVEFLDYNCPNSRMVYDDINKVAATYGNRVKIIFRQFPISSLPGYSDSDFLSQIAFCGWRQGRFQAVHDFIFGKYDELPHPVTINELSTIASATGLQLSKLEECLSDPNTAKEINGDYFDGVEAGVRGTPTFFVNGEKVEGAITFELWKKYFDSLNP